MLEQDKVTNHYREDEFTFGDKIMVCPVLEQGAVSRTVYLPRGKWYNFWSGELLEGEKEHHVEAPLETMPLFVKAGSIIPEYPVMQYVGEKHIDEVKLNVYYSDYEVNSFFFEDHGDTFAYEQDIYSEKKFSVKGDGRSLLIEQTTDGLYTPNYELYSYKVIGIPFTVKRITIDDQETAQFSLDEEGNLNFKSNKNFCDIRIFM